MKIEDKTTKKEEKEKEEEKPNENCCFDHDDCELIKCSDFTTVSKTPTLTSKRH